MVGGVNPSGRLQPLPLVVFWPGLWFRQSRRCTLTPRCQPLLALQSSARGKPLVCRLLNCAQCLPNIALLYLPLTDCSGILRPGSANAALLRHLLSFQSGAAAIFPQGSHSCSHLGTNDRRGFHCRSFQELSQPATQRTTLTHFETHQPSPLSQLPREVGPENSSDHDSELDCRHHRGLPRYAQSPKARRHRHCLTWV